MTYKALRTALVRASAAKADPLQVKLQVRKFRSGVAPPLASSGPLTQTVQNYEKELIESALAESKGKVAGPNGAAAKLAPPSTLHLKIKQPNIKKNSTIR
jgi:transcriptional regulator with GAF, ATPase, and Fis domain